MSTSLIRHSAQNIRAALVIVAFTALAAVGLATAQQFDRRADTAPAAAVAGVTPRQAALLTAPASAPISVAAFHGGF